MKILTVTLLALGLATSLAAQAPSGRMGGSRFSDNPRLTNRLLHFRTSRIQQIVGLPEDKARQVAERWARWDREHLERGRQSVELRRQFNQVLLGPGSDEDKSARLRPLLDQFVSIRAQQEAGRRQFEDEVRSGLTPAQQARLILAMDEIQQRLREVLREAPSHMEK